MEKLPRFVPFGAPKISPDELRAVVDVFRSGWIGTGPKTAKFEAAFAKYVRSRFAVGVSSCTAGLHLSLLVAGVRPGDEVITSSLTFAATANAIEQIGGRVVFADVDPATYNLDPEAVEKKITKRTRAIIPVHFGGLPADLAAFARLARRHRLAIIEDAAHAIGARYRDRLIGGSGNLVSFSFYPNKNLTTIEGGMVTTNGPRRAERLRLLRLHGLDNDAWKRYGRRRLRHSRLVALGFKYNLTDVQSALGLAQLPKVERWLRIRERHARHYDRVFDRIPGIHRQFRPTDLRRNRHALHLYTIRIDPRRFRRSRDEIVDELLKKNIGVSIHYEAVHLHPYYRSKGFRRGMFPNAELIGGTIFSLPLTPYLSASTVAAVARVTRHVLLANRRP